VGQDGLPLGVPADHQDPVATACRGGHRTVVQDADGDRDAGLEMPVHVVPTQGLGVSRPDSTVPQGGELRRRGGRVSVLDDAAQVLVVAVWARDATRLQGLQQHGAGRREAHAPGLAGHVRVALVVVGHIQADRALRGAVAQVYLACGLVVAVGQAQAVGHLGQEAGHVRRGDGLQVDRRLGVVARADESHASPPGTAEDPSSGPSGGCTSVTSGGLPRSSLSWLARSRS